MASRTRGAQERVTPGGAAGNAGMMAPSSWENQQAVSSWEIQQQASAMSTQSLQIAEQSALDLDVTVLAFAQWVTELKTRQHNSQHQMQAEMSIIRNAITTNNTDLSDFKRHSAAIQQQMHSEISEIRESLSNVFMEITSAVRNNAGADQDIKLKIQSLNEQAVRNETAFAQLADAADQSQSKLRNAVQEMQTSSERMRDELVTLNRYVENLENSVGERSDRIALNIDQLGQDQHVQLEHRKEHLKKMVNDVMLIGESLQSLVGDFGEQKKQTGQLQNKLQSSLFVLDQTHQRAGGQSNTPSYDPGVRVQQMALGLPATNETLQQVPPRHTTPMRQSYPGAYPAALSQPMMSGTLRPVSPAPAVGVMYRQ